MFILRRSNAKDIKSAVVDLQDELWPETLSWLKASFPDALKDEVAEPRTAFFPLEAENWVLSENSNVHAIIHFSPRGMGRHRWDQSDRKQVQNRRRFYLLGQTLDAMQVWDVRRALQAIRQDKDLAEVPLSMIASGNLAAVALYASLFERDLETLGLRDLSSAHRSSPYFLNVERYLDMPQAVAMAAERAQVFVEQEETSGWEYPQAVAKQLGWDEKQLQIRRKPK
jgi:hypothetical protein